MARNTNNVRRIRVVAEKLKPIRDRFVFLGGAVTELLVTDAAAAPPRSTLDVDVIVEIATRGELYALQEQLRGLGFCEDSSDEAPPCRWKCAQVLVDIMPTDEAFLDFSNRWYPLACQSAGLFVLDESTTIRLISAPCFLATKVEAFLARGNHDYVASHDLEDVIAVIDGRASIVAEVESSDPAIRDFLATTLGRLLSDEGFRNAIAGHLPSDPASRARLPVVMERLRAIAG